MSFARYFAPAVLLLVGCSEPMPKTGVMPGIATGGYDQPSNAEASSAYMTAFMARYDIPALDYPDDIKTRIKAARRERLVRDMNVMAERQHLMAKLAVSVMASKDPEMKKLAEKLKEDGSGLKDAQQFTLADLDALGEFMAPRGTAHISEKTARKFSYENAVRAYRRDYRSLDVKNCRWTAMKRLIGSGHEAMAEIYSTHPTHGFSCQMELILEKNRGYPRAYSMSSFWVKSDTGQWQYYGKFPGVDTAPRPLSLNPALLKNPEATIMRRRAWEAL